MDLMQQFANPETIGTLSFGDKMLASLLTMCVGLGITFLVLLIIWLFIAIMAATVRRARKAKLAAQEFMRLEPAYVNMHPEDAEINTYRRSASIRRVSKNVSAKATGKTSLAPQRPVPVKETSAEDEALANQQLVAVISAAIAAFEGENVNNLVVTKITRRSNGQSPWTVAGLSERMETRKIL